MASTQTSTNIDAQALVRPLLVKDLRIEARARGLSPAGGAEELRNRIVESMIGGNDLSLKAAAGVGANQAPTQANLNNYSRPGGQQNVGNFITDRASSRVLAPPGGGNNLVLGDGAATAPNPPAAAAPRAHVPTRAPLAPEPAPKVTEPQQQASADINKGAVPGHCGNNYARPGGQQNVGNFITDRASSRVLAPPGGGSQLSLG